jgi:hypothetical protein
VPVFRPHNLPQTGMCINLQAVTGMTQQHHNGLQGGVMPGRQIRRTVG